MRTAVDLRQFPSDSSSCGFRAVWLGAESISVLGTQVRRKSLTIGLLALSQHSRLRSVTTPTTTTTTRRHDDTTTRRHDDTTTRRHNGTTAQQHNSTTPQHNSTTPQQHSTTTQRHNDNDYCSCRLSGVTPTTVTVSCHSHTVGGAQSALTAHCRSHAAHSPQPTVPQSTTLSVSRPFNDVFVPPTLFSRGLDVVALCCSVQCAVCSVALWRVPNAAMLRRCDAAHWLDHVSIWEWSAITRSLTVVDRKPRCDHKRSTT